MEQKLLRLKAILSTLLILFGSVTFLTGAVLYFLEYGMWLIFTRKFINDVHAVSALVMGIVILMHLYLNRKLYKTEMKQLLLPSDPKSNPKP
ncbi:hypothetical protein MASR2M70_09280 [Bacillota bacterium]